ncbi:MAG: hypothetical protein WC516_08010 [Patescibacteria group bacterium]|jgi:hypothetical protein
MITKVLTRDMVGQKIRIYVTNGKRYTGILKDFGDNFIQVNPLQMKLGQSIRFNPEQIISFSIGE